jgi:CRISPR-associated exonuclease Cas4
MIARLIITSVLLAVVGLALAIHALRTRRVRGLISGETVTLDNVTLFSREHLLVGRPDRIVRRGKELIPEEWKSGNKVQPWHIAQLGTYFILIEEHYGVRPPFGVIVTGNGRRERVENTNALRTQVLEVAGKIREARRQFEVEIAVSPERWQCRVCGQHSRCRQARG